jgi:uncharacterized damage-inducible protein DinB
MTDDRQSMLNSLQYSRNHVLGILEGMTDEQLRHPFLRSGWTCLGMVKHLALDVEHYWFRCIVAGESLQFFETESGEAQDAWQVEPDESAAAIFDLYRREIEKANEIINATSLDAPPRLRDERWGDWAIPDLRFIMLHVITETSCHAGHLDAARELADGRQWLVL